MKCLLDNYVSVFPVPGSWHIFDVSNRRIRSYITRSVTKSREWDALSAAHLARWHHWYRSQSCFLPAHLSVVWPWESVMTRQVRSSQPRDTRWATWPSVGAAREGQLIAKLTRGNISMKYLKGYEHTLLDNWCR